MIGRPLFFDPEIYCSLIESYIMSDEVERAFWLLDNPPAFFRDHPTERMKEIRRSLHKALFTPTQYAKADQEAPISPSEYWPERALILARKIEELNRATLTPHVMEIGPGSFWLPHSLTIKSLKFTYESQALREKIFKDEPPGADAPVIFVAFELIEHLANENEIYQAYLKFGREADYVYLSTPLYTYGGGMPHWRENALGHLRTYTPQEFYDRVRNMFPGYAWQCHLNDTIVLEGTKNAT